MKKWNLKPYKGRPIQFLHTHQQNDWTIKLYSISSKGPVVPPALVERAKSLLAKVLPQPALGDEQYGIGFSIIHEGDDGNYVLVSWWTGENMLCHHVYAATHEHPDEFRSFSHTGIAACVWELEILYFEKIAWWKTVLMNNENPAFDEYLSMTYPPNIV